MSCKGLLERMRRLIERIEEAKRRGDTAEQLKALIEYGRIRNEYRRKCWGLRGSSRK